MAVKIWFPLYVRDFLNKWMFASPEVGWLVG
jgi:hypothetical protein